MLPFITVALLIYGAIHLYAFGKVWLAVPHSVAWMLALTLASILLTVSPLIVSYIKSRIWNWAAVAAAWATYTWMGFLFLFFCIALPFDVGHGVALLLHLRWPLNDALEFKATSLLSLLAVAYGLIEAHHIKVKEITITTPKLATGRVTLAQISDLHLGIMMRSALLERVITKLREIKPDILVATGDILDGQEDNLEELARAFHAYTALLPAYAVIGNHEQFAGLDNSLRFLRNAGFIVLRGEAAKVRSIILVGVDDYSGQAADHEARLDTKKALASATKNDFIVLLKHQPVVDSDIQFDLQLSGHIHGGQIFPFVYLTRLVYGVHVGLTKLADGRQLYVNRGAGTWGPPIRVFSPPEITLITIESEKQDFERPPV